MSKKKAPEPKVETCPGGRKVMSRKGQSGLTILQCECGRCSTERWVLDVPHRAG